ncbi:Rod shape-determining protein MreC [Pseudopedobacter saltans DSM 12145]|uniref:Cell shape-determining protein MreC n=1 Tax=Pseudopedobacter saltans (strain ATCC 51119 / DSM 12145 / JCM 21818 / CCUG 39354 / LMG 10337 / NBRC 100064 / NCIMB 13643) TaxID=762903 RepID=F0SC47_PSESL|nr:rod shape-determining protein MreC [Pseudopedobacter saltans]ADY50632.1 Rod shape-determining protein MreC [Pseudopedobacter saltans DSM 12145]
MRNLWRFISNYNAFFLFVIFFTTSIILLVRNNDFQRASTLNSSNQIIGNIYNQVSGVTKYLHLDVVNDSLAKENARLRNMLPSSFFSDSLKTQLIKDTVHRVQYEYLEAQVINKTITSRNNYLTINKGSLHGIKKGMGVIGPSGVVGIVWNVSKDFASIQSVLHEDTRISSLIEGTPYFGPLMWNGKDPNVVTLSDIPNQLHIKKGMKVVTSGLGRIFPKGIIVGTVIASGVKGGGNFLDINVKLATDFYSLQHVYVIRNFFAEEQALLEEQNKESINE